MLSLVTAVLILSATFDSAKVLASVLGLKVSNNECTALQVMNREGGCWGGAGGQEEEQGQEEACCSGTAQGNDGVMKTSSCGDYIKHDACPTYKPRIAWHSMHVRRM